MVSMIGGNVNSRRQAVVRLRVRGPEQTERDVSAMIDTGFTAFLTLSSTIVAALGLIYHSVSAAGLADGSVSQFGIYAAEVEWDGHWRPILVSAVGDQPLIGMQLLAGHRLLVDVARGGAVEFSPLP